jgi:hypothetical protein
VVHGIDSTAWHHATRHRTVEYNAQTARGMGYVSRAAVEAGRRSDSRLIISSLKDVCLGIETVTLTQSKSNAVVCFGAWDHPSLVHRTLSLRTPHHIHAKAL